MRRPEPGVCGRPSQLDLDESLLRKSRGSTKPSRAGPRSGRSQTRIRDPARDRSHPFSLGAGFAFLAVVVGWLGYGFRDELSQFGSWFVSRFGVAGIIAGASLADGLRFPLPP